jgi:hypothetical protein
MDNKRVLRDLVVGAITSYFPAIMGGAVIVLAWLGDLPAYQLLLLILFTIVLVLWGVNQIGVLQEKRRRGIGEVSDKEVYETIRGWLDDPIFTFQRKMSDECLFQFVVSEEGGRRPVTVSRTKAKAGQLSLSTSITLGEEHRKKYERLGNKEKDKIVHNLRIEMARYGIGFSGIDKGLQRVKLSDVVLLDNALTEFYLRQRIFYVTGGFVLYDEKMSQELMDVIEEESYKEGSESD